VSSQFRAYFSDIPHCISLTVKSPLVPLRVARVWHGIPISPVSAARPTFAVARHVDRVGSGSIPTMDIAQMSDWRDTRKRQQLPLTSH
jgi:hypothetical protein